MAVGVARGGAINEAAENGTDDGSAVGVGLGLEPGVGNIVLADESKLLGKVVPRLMWGVGDGEWEGNVSDAS